MARRAPALLLFAASAPRRAAGLRYPTRVPAEWEEVAAPPPGAAAPVTVALRQRDPAALAAAFAAVTDPASPRYGRYLSAADVRALTDAPAAEAQAVLRWLEGAGVPRAALQYGGDHIRVDAPARVVEAALRTRLATHRHRRIEGLARTHFAADYEVPDDVAPYVEFVSGLHAASGVRAPARAVEAADAADAAKTYIVPATLRTMYGVPAGERAAAGNQSVASFGFVPREGFSADDLAAWWADNGVAPTPVAVKNGTAQPGAAPTPETTLDIQYITTVGAGAPTVFEPFSAMSLSGAFYDHAAALAADPARPLVVSISWGEGEDDYNANRIRRTDAEYMKLGAMGVSVLVASGDSGACPVTQGGKLGGGGYPSASAYVTSVGATMTDPKRDPSPQQPTFPAICDQYPCTKARPEVVASDKTGSKITSGGGFSTYISQPAYQAAAVAAYLKSNATKPKSSYYDKANRGYPDVSANGNCYLAKILYQGKPYIGAYGTSDSTPTVAGIFSLINSRLLSKGKPPLGFANPLLYKMAASSPGAFNDIIEGDNAAGEQGEGCPAGYGAASGWDPASGLGTPNFAKIVTYLESEGLL